MRSVGIPVLFTVFLIFVGSYMSDEKFRTKVLENTATILKKMRNKYSLSQEELAKMLNLDLENIKAIENETMEISSASWYLFCLIFDVNRDSIFIVD